MKLFSEGLSPIIIDMSEKMRYQYMECIPSHSWVTP